MLQPQYPIKVNFKIISWGPQIVVRDAQDRQIFFVHQKALKLKEDVRVYSDQSKSQELYQMKADRVIDWSAQYNFTDNSTGMAMGAVKREGMRSLWSARYNISNESGQITHHIMEDNPWIKVLDALLSEIPFVAFFMGYFLHPSYTVHQSGTETAILRLRKKPSFFEAVFEIEKITQPLNDSEETRLLLSLMMMILLERTRG